MTPQPYAKLRFIVLVVCLILELSIAEVVYLTDETFDATVMANGTQWLVLFSAPACTHCRLAVQLLKEALPQLGNYRAAELHCTVDGYDQCRRFNVEKMPRLSIVSPSEGLTWDFGKPLESASVNDIRTFAEKGYKEEIGTPIPATPPPKKPNFVVPLGDGNITLAEMSESTWIILFYTPQCSYCKQMELLLQELSRQLEPEGEVKCASLNVQKDTFTMKRYRVISYPTVIAIKDGHYHTFNGRRALAELKAFLAAIDSQPGQPLPSHEWGLKQNLEMFYSEIKDAVDEVMSKPHLRDYAIKYGLAMLIIIPTASCIMAYLALKLMGENTTAEPTEGDKKND